MTEGETLLALMEQDLAIARAVKALDELPEKAAILQLRHRLKEIEGVAEKARAYVQRANAMVAKSADEVQMVQAKIDAEQAKVLSGQITDSKELRNLTREIDALSRRKDQLEREELGLMEKAESGEAQRAKVDAALEEGRAKEADLIERYKSRGGEIQTETARLRAERDAIARMLDGSVLARYERLREAKKGVAVGALKGALCTACRTEIPAGEVQALRAGPEVAECPNCKRMLVIVGDA
ncbi:zinc ribbon domain-containing protein [Anaerosoma tenue]|uniref:zinc ribbon domain-containing protein n=1 Tax=Anaerosoma tenue TaxID=2933588 RepID=UPI0022609EAA|nr:C4-type zinc ribbon domain-containing protein [Anaerosoma tenue]MCK8114138.1 C4-type zinc ribbon domain-containing protein [Anaerosoma tenue]